MTIHLALQLSIAFFALVLPITGFAAGKEKPASSLQEFPDRSLFHLESEWTDQNGKKMRLSGMERGPRIISMVFTSCPSACPLTVQEIKNLESSLPENARKNVRVSLFSMDDEETAATLDAFMKKYKLDGSTWSVHRSSALTISELAAALSFSYKRLDSGDFVHANVLFLVDENGVVVAKSEGLGGPNEEFTKAVKKSFAP